MKIWIALLIVSISILLGCIQNNSNLGQKSVELDSLDCILPSWRFEGGETIFFDKLPHQFPFKADFGNGWSGELQLVCRNGSYSGENINYKYCSPFPQERLNNSGQRPQVIYSLSRQFPAIVNDGGTILKPAYEEIFTFEKEKIYFVFDPSNSKVIKSFCNIR